MYHESLTIQRMSLLFRPGKDIIADNETGIMTIKTPSRKQVKAELRRIRRHKSSPKRRSNKKRSTGSADNTKKLQQLAENLPDPTSTEEQSNRGRIEDDEEGSESLNHLLRGKL